jgi:hypothetical protein
MPSLERTRQPFIDKIKALLNTVDKKLYKSIYKNDIRLTQLILDVTSPTLPMRFQTDELIHEIESLTRGLCFALHHEHCRLLDIALVVIGTDCTGSCKSNYHTITTTPIGVSKTYILSCWYMAYKSKYTYIDINTFYLKKYIIYVFT